MINHRGPYDACKGIQLVQTALLGQIYAILSKVQLTSMSLGSRLTHLIEPEHSNDWPDLPQLGLLLGATLRYV